MRLYIDPGTGAMLFSIVTGIVSVLWFGARKLFMGLKYRTGGKVNTNDNVIPLVIFSDNKRYWRNFEPVIREMDKRGIDMHYMTQSPDDPALSSPYTHLRGEFIGEGNKGLARMNFLKATMVLATTPGLDVYQWKRSKEVRWYTHMQHGANEMTTYRMFGIDFYDGLLVSGQYQRTWFLWEFRIWTILLQGLKRTLLRIIKRLCLSRRHGERAQFCASLVPGSSMFFLPLVTI